MAEEARPPTGRTEVEEALLEAAADLLAERGPDAISGRDIARRAGVNYGLLHHYFGPKAAVLNAAMVKLNEAFIAEFIETDDGDRLAPILEVPRRLVRASAYVELSNSGVVKRIDDYPTLRRELAVMAELFESSTEDPEVQARAAVWVAAQLGWVVFEGLLSEALISEDNSDEVRRRASQIIAAVADPSN